MDTLSFSGFFIFPPSTGAFSFPRSFFTVLPCTGVVEFQRKRLVLEFSPVLETLTLREKIFRARISTVLKIFTFQLAPFLKKDLTTLTTVGDIQLFFGREQNT